MGVSCLPKTVIRQRRACDLKRGPSEPESSTLTTRCRCTQRYYAIRIACGSVIKRSSVHPSVRPSICPVNRQQQRRPAGLLLRSGAGSRHRSIAAAVARHAGRANFGPTLRRSNILARKSRSDPQHGAMRPLDSINLATCWFCSF